MTFIVDGTNGLTYPNSTVQASAGVVLQVVNATYSTFTSSTSATFANTGLAASITPKFSTSKILIIVDANGVSGYPATSSVGFQITRGASVILNYESIAAYLSGYTGNIAIGSSSATYLDSPATTSSTTYNLQFARTLGSGTVYINNYGFAGGTISTITLMEIAG